MGHGALDVGHNVSNVGHDAPGGGYAAWVVVRSWAVLKRSTRSSMGA